MADRRRTRTMLGVLTLVALLLITVDYRQGEDGPLDALRRGSVTAFAPLQEGFARLVQPVGTAVTAVAQLGELRAQNLRLEEEVAELQEEMPSVADLERENAELRELLGMAERLELTTTGARVIGQPPGERGNSVLVDAGANQGVEAGMAVLSARGMVGKVVEVTRSHARIELVSSPTARYAVRVAESGDTGLLRGQGADPFQVELLDPDAEVEEGQQVVTRTFTGSTIPDGLPVGELGAVEEGAGAQRYLPVRPYVDFSGLSFVQVVLDAPETPVELDPDELIEGEPAEPPRPDDDGDDGDDAGEGGGNGGDG